MFETVDRRPRVSLLITDLDNTLWDWFDAWHRSFAAMLDRLSVVSGIPKPTLVREIHLVHQRRGTTEYSLLLQELPSLQALHPPGTDLLTTYDDVVHVLNRERKRATTLYPRVLETLEAIRASNVPIIAYTESIAFWTEWRIQLLGLDGVIDVLYSSPDHDMPAHVELSTLRNRPPEDYGLKQTKHLHVAPGIIKPDIHVLATILDDHALTAGDAVYVGDSLMRDVAMAQRMGVHDVWARYGASQNRDGYQLLQSVSYWRDEEVKEEQKQTAEPTIAPTFTLDRFDELLTLFDFGGTQ